MALGMLAISQKYQVLFADGLFIVISCFSNSSMPKGYMLVGYCATFLGLGKVTGVLNLITRFLCFYFSTYVVGLADRSSN